MNTAAMGVGCARGAMFFFTLLSAALVGARAGAANITWIGENSEWIEGTVNDPNGDPMWSPADEPDFDDTAIFNTADAVNLGRPIQSWRSRCRQALTLTPTTLI